MKYSRLALTLLLYTLSSATLWAVGSQSTTFRNQQLNQEISGKQIEQQFVKKDWISLHDKLAKYRLSKNHDPILADFVEASLLIEVNHRPDLALPLYEKILTQHPDYIFVRLAYAQALFADKQYALTEKQFAPPNKDYTRLPYKERNFTELISKTFISSNLISTSTTNKTIISTK